MNPVPPSIGQNQSAAIPVPKRIQYQYWDNEDGPWGMIPYAFLYPKPPPVLFPLMPHPIYRTTNGPAPVMNLAMSYKNEDGVTVAFLPQPDVVFVPPPVYTTEIFAATQPFPVL